MHNFPYKTIVVHLDCGNRRSERRREKCAEDAAYEFDRKTIERKIKAEWRSTVGDAVGAVC
jgi:hypothetical protein